MTASSEANDLGATTSAIEAGLVSLDLPDGVTVRIGGVSQQQAESFRDLEGAVNRLLAHATLTGTAVTLDTAEVAIRDLVRNREPKRVRIEDIQKLVASRYNVSRSDILSERYDNELQSIVTTNIPDAGQLASRYDSRIADRLLDDDGVYAVCGGPSMRGVGQDG